MKRKITKEYMFVFTSSIALIIVIWLILTFIFVLSGKQEDDQAPQYLVNRFEEYIDFSSELEISDDGKRVLSRNDLWVQIIDKKGEVLKEYGVPEGIPRCYDVFEITSYALNSNMLSNQTIFLSQCSQQPNYGVIIGCDSSKVSKISIKFTGGLGKTMIKSALILLSVFIFIGIISGVFFSKCIAAPVSDMIENINHLEKYQKDSRSSIHRGIFQDVFESLKKLQIRLESADLERKNAEKQREEWIMNISHDMKTPLATIKGYAEIMLDNDYDISDCERRLYSSKIINSAEVIKEFVDELKFGRLLKNGEWELQTENVNICRLLKECCDDIPIDYKKGQITFEFEKEAMYTFVDKQLMRRCFMNIICNAILHNCSPVEIMIKCYQLDKMMIEITDYGKGMSEEEITQVFERYYRGRSSKETAGSGLGLAIAKAIIEAHKGSISVKSEEGKGSTFVISI